MKTKLKRAADILLTLLVMAGSLGLAWIGLTGTDSIMTIADELTSSSPEAVSPAPSGTFTVVIDAGHGGFDGGAVGSNGVCEAELNLSVALFLKDMLEEKGLEVIMTRNDENALAETKSGDMDERKRIMLDENADIVVSVHMNKFRDKTVSGPMVFYMEGSAEGKTLADHIIGCLCEKVGRTKRNANPEDLFVLREPKAPSVLVECGFLSNAAEEALLQTEEYRISLAQGICEGILEYKAYKESGDT